MDVAAGLQSFQEIVMRRWLCVVVSGALLAGLGCGTSTNRGIHTAKDLPRSAERTASLPSTGTRIFRMAMIATSSPDRPS